MMDIVDTYIKNADVRSAVDLTIPKLEDKLEVHITACISVLWAASKGDWDTFYKLFQMEAKASVRLLILFKVDFSFYFTNVADFTRPMKTFAGCKERVLALVN